MTKSQVRAVAVSTLATVASFGALLAVAYAGCTLSSADCNTVSFIMLPILAVAVGAPAMILLGAFVLRPLWVALKRQGRAPAVPMILAGLLPGVILSALALARQGPLEPARAASIGAYVIIAVGIPGAIGAYVLHRLLQRAV